MDKTLEILKEELEMFGIHNKTITVSREDLVNLYNAYESATGRPETSFDEGED